jgi:hypothetical protein
MIEEDKSSGDAVICSRCGCCRPDLYSFTGFKFGNTLFWFCEHCTKNLCYSSVRDRLEGKGSTETESISDDIRRRF